MSAYHGEIASNDMRVPATVSGTPYLLVQHVGVALFEYEEGVTTGFFCSRIVTGVSKCLRIQEYEE
jgi:hypothetical protein